MKDCWQRGAGRGFGCRVDRCRSCTNTSCGDELLPESGISLSLSPGEVFTSNVHPLGDGWFLSQVLLRQPVSLAASTGAAAQPNQTIFAPRSPKGAPAVLISATHISSDLLANARLKNVGEKTIVAYCVGWEVHIPGQKKPETTLGEWMNVPPGIPRRICPGSPAGRLGRTRPPRRNTNCLLRGGSQVQRWNNLATPKGRCRLANELETNIKNTVTPFVGLRKVSSVSSGPESGAALPAGTRSGKKPPSCAAACRFSVCVRCVPASCVHRRAKRRLRAPNPECTAR